MTAGAVTLVTGATGFLGRRLAERLVEEGGAVRGLARPGSAPLPPGVDRAELVDLEDGPALRRAMAGVDVVIHLAARVHVMRDTVGDSLAEFRRVNVEGTRALLAAAAEAGVRRFVFASSVKAMGEGSPDPYTESTPARPADPYGVSKLEAEALLRDHAAATGMEVAALRLPMVYGPGMKGNMLRLFRLVERGMPLPFGGIRNRRSMLFVENAADAFLTVLRAPAAGMGTFLCSDGDDLSTPELVRRIARALGRRVPLVNVPESWFRAAGRLGDAASRLAPLPVTSATIDRLLGSLYLDVSRLKRTTGYAPRFSATEGIERTAEWYRREGR